MEAHVPSEMAGLRLDRVLPFLFSGHSRSELQRLVEAGEVLLNGKASKKRVLVKEGDRVELTIQPRCSDVVPQHMPFDILYEDDKILVINKPPGLVVHPAPGHWEGTFVNGLLAHCRDLDKEDPIRPGIVHRLDKDTSGVLIAAKTTPVLYNIAQQFHDRSVEKEYIAIVVGAHSGSCTVTGAIARDPVHKTKMSIQPTGKAAQTEVIFLSSSKDLSLVLARPLTGRTHQIRVHLASIHHPVLGDSVYGRPCVNRKMNVSRQMLHCRRIVFLHPVTGKKLILEAPLPPDMEQILEETSLFFPVP